MIVLKGSIVTPTEIIKDGVVIVDGNKIRTVGASGKVKIPVSAKFIDCRGKFISPGLIDVHVQGAGGCDILDGNYEAINTISKTLAKNGTTAFLATTVIKITPRLRSGQANQAHIDTVCQAMKKGTDGAEVLGAHLEGPFISPVKCGMIKKENIAGAAAMMGTLCGDINVKRSQSQQGVPNMLQAIIDACRGSLKMMTIAPEMPGAIDIIKKLKKNKIVASIGHTNATYEEAIKGFDAGITHATHMFNAMSALNHRQPGVAGAVLTDDRISAQLIADGMHLHPAVVKLVVRQKGIEKIALITDSMSAAGLPDGKYVYNDLRYESKDGLAVYCGTDTFIGTALTLNKIVKRIVDMGIVDLKDAVRMASLTPAEVLGISNKKGSLEAGKDADIVVMDKDCDVSMTIIGGVVVASGANEVSEAKQSPRSKEIASSASLRSASSQ